MKYKLTYSDVLPEVIGGRCEYPTLPKWGTCEVVIRPKYADDAGLLAHELVHVLQYDRSVWHTLRLWWSKDYKYACEREAYLKQAEVYGYSRKEQYRWMAEAICNKYGLSLTVEKVLEDLVRDTKK